MVAAFDQVLGEKLAAIREFPETSEVTRSSFALPFPTAPDPGLRFALWTAGRAFPPIASSLADQARAKGYGRDASHAHGTSAPASPRQRRPVRTQHRPHRLTPRAQAAFDELRRIGASRLHRAFTHDELRHEFRALALRFHPDRHPRLGDAERSRLAATFSRLTAAYRELLKVVDPAA